MDYLCVKTKHARKYSDAHLTGQEFPNVNRKSKRKGIIITKKKVSHSFLAVARQVGLQKKPNAKYQHASPVFNSSYFLDSINRVLPIPQQTVPFSIISSEPLQPSSPARNKEMFYTILAALSAHPFWMCPLSTTANFPFLNFFSLTFSLQPGIVPPSFPPLPSFMLPIPASARSSSISQNRAFTFCLSPASTELDRWVP